MIFLPFSSFSSSRSARFFRAISFLSLERPAGAGKPRESEYLVEAVGRRLPVLFAIGKGPRFHDRHPTVSGLLALARRHNLPPVPDRTHCPAPCALRSDPASR